MSIESPQTQVLSEKPLYSSYTASSTQKSSSLFSADTPGRPSLRFTSFQEPFLITSAGCNLSFVSPYLLHHTPSPLRSTSNPSDLFLFPSFYPSAGSHYPLPNYYSFPAFCLFSCPLQPILDTAVFILKDKYDNVT